MHSGVPHTGATMPSPPRTGHQIRTETTKARLLAAAEEAFVRDGFEGAQLAQIAKAAGRTKGSIYAHYNGKDDLFLAICEHRTRREMSRLLDVVKDCGTAEAAIPHFKNFLLEFVKDKTWPLLTLEFKLYAVRHPESRDLWSRAHDMTRLMEQEQLQQKLRGKLYASLPAAERKRRKTAMAALGPILAAMALETYFEPKRLSDDRLRALLSQIFDVLLSP
jgi:AcrR family transcriptional regulator